MWIINHRGSASLIESESAKDIFGRPKEKFDPEYTTHIRDRDSASLKQVHDSELYIGKEIVKQ